MKNFISVKKVDCNVYDNKLIEIKNIVDDGLRKTPKTKLIEYMFEKVPRGFVQDL